MFKASIYAQCKNVTIASNDKNRLVGDAHQIQSLSQWMRAVCPSPNFEKTEYMVIKYLLTIRLPYLYENLVLNGHGQQCIARRKERALSAIAKKFGIRRIAQVSERIGTLRVLLRQ